jgi:hypothetical protein
LGVSFFENRIDTVKLFNHDVGGKNMSDEQQRVQRQQEERVVEPVYEEKEKASWDTLENFKKTS